MVRYREILRLTAMGISQRNVAFSVGCAASTVQDVLRAARKVGLERPLLLAPTRWRSRPAGA
jgi:transposase